jgi:hypothetical protein
MSVESDREKVEESPIASKAKHHGSTVLTSQSVGLAPSLLQAL